MKKIIFYLLALALIAGVFVFPEPARAEDDILRQILEVLKLLPEIKGNIGGKKITLKARFDRGQFVYGTPGQVPDNDWKHTGTSWEQDNGINLGHPQQEPRYLGYTIDGIDKFSNDWFPVDATFIAPAKRKLIAEPWGKGLCKKNPDNLTDTGWGVIRAVLVNYHNAIGFQEKAGFLHNPALKDFSDVKKYFKVLARPLPGVTGAVRH